MCTSVEGNSVLRAEGEKFFDLVNLLGLGVVLVCGEVRMLVVILRLQLFWRYSGGSLSVGLVQTLPILLADQSQL